MLGSAFDCRQPDKKKKKTQKKTKKQKTITKKDQNKKHEGFWEEAGVAIKNLLSCFCFSLPIHRVVLGSNLFALSTIFTYPLQEGLRSVLHCPFLLLDWVGFLFCALFLLLDRVGFLFAAPVFLLAHSCFCHRRFCTDTSCLHPLTPSQPPDPSTPSPSLGPSTSAYPHRPIDPPTFRNASEVLTCLTFPTSPPFAL